MMIRTDESNAFAHHTVRVRLPDIVRDTLALNPHFAGTDIEAEMDMLAHDLTHDAPIAPLRLPAPDYAAWQAAHVAHAGDTWLNTEWFYAEIYFYRLIMQAVRWWETGLDPFRPKKDEEYAGARVWELLQQALDAQPSAAERLYHLLTLDLWSNRIDLSFAAALAHGHTAQDDDLLVDDRDAVVAHLLGRRGAVHLIVDNAGSELAMDCALADGLLDTAADTVVLHLKLHPTFVSDATVTDFWHFVALLEARAESNLRALGLRLRDHVQRGRLRLAPDPYWNSTLTLDQLPAHLHTYFQTARLVLVKGDANYRRMVEDRLWPPDKPLAEVVAHFPAPIAALRSLKSDPIVGLPGGRAAQLDSIDPLWRVNGKRGVLQARLTL